MAKERQMGITLDKIERLHRDRYEYVSKFCKDKTVIDCACGNGYGSHMLSRVAKLVTGFDYAKTAIDMANKYYKAKNIMYTQTNIDDLKECVGGCNADVLVSLETIEHLNSPIETTLKKYGNSVKRGGLVIISFPNNQGINSRNCFHKHFNITTERIASISKEISLTIQSEWLQPREKHCGYMILVLKKI